MIKIMEIVNTNFKETLEVDEHVPFNIEWNYISNRNLKYYWRTGDFKKSLLEIGLDSVTGLIKSMTLTNLNINSISEDNLPTNFSKLGVPKFDLTQWTSEKYLDYTKDFSVLLMNNGLVISMLDERVERIVKSDRVLFHMGKDKKLLRIDLINLTTDERHILRNSLRSY
ncbi:hypothetical protein [Paenibacillus aquistagni]|uniref:hypothetical protein n=1 Tax=Paenibacillus aquistagni TaxID=1852522 RepID=UPI00145B431B|nr:hypothetical protein [Paenibacillus aquistagni]NMM54748.1 hypothetical protein [Paenibacillus aquistagni]